MNQDTMDKTILLEEWKERYASYRQYRAQYLTVLSVAVTGWLIGMGLSLKDENDGLSRSIILIFILILTSCIIAAHWIARKEVTRLGERISLLEKNLNMGDFHTTRLLEMSMLVSTIGSIIIFIITLSFLIYI